MATNNPPIQTGVFALNAVEDTPLAFTAAQLLTAFNDPDGNPLTLSLPSLSGLEDLGGGNYRYTPTANFNGSFFSAGTATISDGFGGSLQVQLGINVSAVNDAPQLLPVWGGVAAVHTGGREFGMGAITLPNGQFLVGGSTSREGEQTGFALWRMNADGSRDLGFAGDGQADLFIGSSNQSGVRVAHHMGSGAVVMAAQTSGNGANVRDFGVMRFNADGSVDTGFGGGTGFRVIDVANSETLRALSVTGDGKIVLAGYGRPVGATSDVAIIHRLNLNGDSDPGFNGSGVVTFDLSANNAERIEAVAVMDSGKVVAVGRAMVAGVNQFAVLRLNGDGTPDTTFNGTGSLLIAAPGATSASARAVHVANDGTVYVAGYANDGSGLDHFTLLCISAAGVHDTSWPNGGFARADFPGLNAEAYGLLVQGDGKFVLTGEVDISSSSSTVLGAARFNANGTLDTSFNGSGTALVPVSEQSFAGVLPALLADGSLVVVGQTFSAANTSGDLALARLDANGVPLSGFNAYPAVGLQTRGTSFLVSEAELLRGWSDVESGPALVVSAVNVQPGSVVLEGPGSYRVTPPPNFGGTLTLQYTVSDGAAQNTGTRQFFMAAPTNTNATAGNDSLVGTASADNLNALAGNDTVIGMGGADTLVGGEGNDQLFGAAGSSGEPLMGDLADSLDGGNGDDTLRGNTGNDTLRGGAGNDNLRGDAGSDVMEGGDGDGDFASYRFDEAGAFPNGVARAINLDWSAIGPGYSGTLDDGLGGMDTVSGIESLGITGSRLNDTLIGSAMRDQIAGHAGDDRVDGGAGDDLLGAGNLVSAQAGNDTLRGGLGNDTYSYFADQLQPDVLAATDGFDVIFNGDSGESAVPGAGFDTLQLNNISGDHVHGWRDGNDFNLTLQASTRWSDPPREEPIGGVRIKDLFSGNAADVIDRINLTDVYVLVSLVPAAYVRFDIYEVEGNVLGDSELYSVAPGAVLLGGAGTQRLHAGDGPQTLNGGAGIDTAMFRQDAPGGISANMATGVVVDGGGATDTLIGIEYLVGSPQADTVQGSEDDNALEGLAGADRLEGRGGNDTLEGDAGNDTLDGGEGYDAVRYEEALDGVSVHLGNGLGSAAREGSDSLLNIEAVWGSYNADSLVGSDRDLGALGNEELIGNDGNDTLQGLGGGDHLAGDEGSDQLDAGDGDDSLDGGPGADTLRGGAGTDRLGFWRSDERGLGSADVDLEAGSSHFHDATDAVFDIEDVDGTLQGADLLRGSAGNNQLRGFGGNDRIDGRAGDDTLDAGSGVDTVEGGTGDDVLVLDGTRGQYQLSTLSDGLFRLQRAATQEDVQFSGVEQLRFADGQFALASMLDPSQGGPGSDTLTGDLNANRLSGNGGNDTLLGMAGDDVLDGGTGNDRLDGGEGYDVASYAGADAINLDMRTGTVQRGADTDTLVNIEVVFASAGSDTLRGRDDDPVLRGDTLRGGAGNDTIDGGTGVDSAEWLGQRGDYVVTRVNATTWTVRDNNLSNGDDGTDTLINVERFVFDGQLLALGSRAEELARVAMVLWGPAIIGSAALFCRGFSFYDTGHSFDLMSRIALQFFPDVGDTQLANQLITNSGSTKTSAQLLTTLANNGGGVLGRAAMVREIALDAATTNLIVAAGIRDNGIVVDHFAPDFGYLFQLMPGG